MATMQELLLSKGHSEIPTAKQSATAAAPVSGELILPDFGNPFAALFAKREQAKADQAAATQAEQAKAARREELKKILSWAEALTAQMVEAFTALFMVVEVLAALKGKALSPDERAERDSNQEQYNTLVGWFKGILNARKDQKLDVPTRAAYGVAATAAALQQPSVTSTLLETLANFLRNGGVIAHDETGTMRIGRDRFVLVHAIAQTDEGAVIDKNLQALETKRRAAEEEERTQTLQGLRAWVKESQISLSDIVNGADGRAELYVPDERSERDNKVFRLDGGFLFVEAAGDTVTVCGAVQFGGRTPSFANFMASRIDVGIHRASITERSLVLPKRVASEEFELLRGIHRCLVRAWTHATSQAAAADKAEEVHRAEVAKFAAMATATDQDFLAGTDPDKMHYLVDNVSKFRWYRNGREAAPALIEHPLIVFEKNEKGQVRVAAFTDRLQKMVDSVPGAQKFQDPGKDFQNLKVLGALLRLSLNRHSGGKQANDSPAPMAVESEQAPADTVLVAEPEKKTARPRRQTKKTAPAASANAQ